MPPRKTATLGQMALAASPPAPVPALVEYTVHGEAWRCEHFDQLVGEFETVTPPDLERFHAAAALHPRRWLFVRRLFGLQPVVPGPDTDPEDLRVWSREELCGHFQLSRPQLKAELDAVRGTWAGFVRPVAPEVPVKPPEPPTKPTFELNLADDPLLKEFNFRVKFANQDERDWFVQKVADFAVVLREKIVSGMAHTACLTALRLHRLNYRLDTYEQNDIGSKGWKADYELASEIGEEYNKQIKQILDLCPTASHLAGKLAFQPQIAAITSALLEVAQGNGTRLIDGLFTAAEIQVQHRMSVQMPEPRYRVGWVLAMNSAKAGLFDPHWKCPFEEPFLALLTQAYNAAFMAGAQKTGLAIPDLEADGPGSEFADLSIPVEKVKVKTENEP